MCVLGKRAHKRQVNMDVRVYEAGKDEFASGVNYLGAGWGLEVALDAGDGFVFA